MRSTGIWTEFSIPFGEVFFLLLRRVLMVRRSFETFLRRLLMADTPTVNTLETESSCRRRTDLGENENIETFLRRVLMADTPTVKTLGTERSCGRRINLGENEKIECSNFVILF